MRSLMPRIQTPVKVGDTLWELRFLCVAVSPNVVEEWAPREITVESIEYEYYHYEGCDPDITITYNGTSPDDLFWTEAQAVKESKRRNKHGKKIRTA